MNKSYNLVEDMWSVIRKVGDNKFYKQNLSVRNYIPITRY